MTSLKIQGLILSRIDFNNPALLPAVEALAVSASALARAGEQFDDVFPEGSGDAVSEGALDLADAFAQVASPDKNQFVKDAFNAVFSAGTPEQEVAGEALFAAALDFDLAANAINALLTVSEE